MALDTSSLNTLQTNVTNLAIAAGKRKPFTEGLRRFQDARLAKREDLRKEDVHNLQKQVSQFQFENAKTKVAEDRKSKIFLTATKQYETAPPNTDPAVITRIVNNMVANSPKGLVLDREKLLKDRAINSATLKEISKLTKARKGLQGTELEANVKMTEEMEAALAKRNESSQARLDALKPAELRKAEADIASTEATTAKTIATTPTREDIEFKQDFQTLQTESANLTKQIKEIELKNANDPTLPDLKVKLAKTNLAIAEQNFRIKQETKGTEKGAATDAQKATRAESTIKSVISQLSPAFSASLNILSGEKFFKKLAEQPAKIDEVRKRLAEPKNAELRKQFEAANNILNDFFGVETDPFRAQIRKQLNDGKSVAEISSRLSEAGLDPAEFSDLLPGTIQ